MSADVVLSTATQEFYGVSMLEGVSFGCVPLAPNALSYKELYPKDPCLYNTPKQLLKKLEYWIRNSGAFRSKIRLPILDEINVTKYTLSTLTPQYHAAIDILPSSQKAESVTKNEVEINSGKRRKI